MTNQRTNSRSNSTSSAKRAGRGLDRNHCLTRSLTTKGTSLTWSLCEPGVSFPPSLRYTQLTPSVVPTPSSDRQKWWLDGQSAKAIPTPPSDEHILNPARSSNPFSEHSLSSEPEWVRVDPPPSIRSLSSSESSTLPRALVTHKLPPPYNAANTPIPARKPVPVADVRTERKILPPPLEPTTKHIIRAPPPPERVLVAPPYQDNPPPVPVASRPPTQQAKIVKKQPPPKPVKPATLTKSVSRASSPHPSSASC